MNDVVLLTEFIGPELERLTAAFGRDATVAVVRTVSELHGAVGVGTLLLSFGTSVIVPKQVLVGIGRAAYNLHAASPEFPGRDPHNHAIYHETKMYGATFHVMTAQVDAGPIFAVERFPVPEGATPLQILALANDAGFRLVQRFARRLLANPAPPAALAGVVWGPNKTQRADLYRLSRITPDMDEGEYRRRRRAFASDGYANLYVDLFGDRFFFRGLTPTAVVSDQSES